MALQRVEFVISGDKYYLLQCPFLHTMIVRQLKIMKKCERLDTYDPQPKFLKPPDGQDSNFCNTYVKELNGKSESYIYLMTQPQKMESKRKENVKKM